MRYQLMQQVVVTFGLAMLIAATAAADDPANPPTISVTGEANIKVKPDQAVFSFSIQGREKTLDESVATNDQAIAKVMQFLKTSGVEDKDVRTEVVQIQPIYRSPGFGKMVPQVWRSGSAPIQSNLNPNPPVKDEDPLKPIGYEARRGMSVTIDDLASLEKIYTGLLKNGVNQIGGISFQTTELRKYRDEARLKAVKAAREKAEAMAGELGAKLAGVQQISESNWGPRPSTFQNSVSLAPRLAAPSGSTITQGDIDVTASVSVVFLLGDHKF